MEAVLKKAVAVKLDQSTRERIKRLAIARHRAPHWVMHEAIQQYVDREEKRESFKQDAVRAWDHFQATGLHLTMEEADVWLEKLESGIDEEPPLCHD
jgi:predicted transcriptional regulator